MATLTVRNYCPTFVHFPVIKGFDTPNLMPGDARKPSATKVDARYFEALSKMNRGHGAVKWLDRMIKSRMLSIDEQRSTSTVEDSGDAPDNLLDRSPSAAEAIILATDDIDLLSRWLENEKRTAIKAAIKGRISFLSEEEK